MRGAPNAAAPNIVGQARICKVGSWMRLAASIICVGIGDVSNVSTYIYVHLTRFRFCNLDSSETTR
jgi:hypothetical protein